MAQPNQSNSPNQTSEQPPNLYQVPPSTQPEEGVGGKLGLALAIGFGATLLGAVVWAGLAYLTNSYFVLVAVLVGFAVSYALASPFKKPLSDKVLLPLVLPALGLTIVALLLGNLLALTLIAVKAGAPFAEGFALATSLFTDLMLSRDGLMPVFFSVLGVGLAFFQLVRKR